MSSASHSPASRILSPELSQALMAGGRAADVERAAVEVVEPEPLLAVAQDPTQRAELRSALR
jgi:hypothetical protein